MHNTQQHLWSFIRPVYDLFILLNEQFYDILLLVALQPSLWPFPPVFLPQSLLRFAIALPVFHIEQFGAIVPQFAFPSVPQLSSGSSSSKTFFQHMFWDSIVEHTNYEGCLESDAPHFFPRKLFIQNV